MGRSAGRVAGRAVGTGRAGPGRRSGLQRAGRGVRAGHVHEARVRHHLARVPQPLLVLRRAQARGRAASGTARARRLDRDGRQPAGLLTGSYRRGVCHARPAAAPAAVRRRAGSCSDDVGNGCAASGLEARIALFRLRHAE